MKISPGKINLEKMNVTTVILYSIVAWFFLYLLTFFVTVSPKDSGSGGKLALLDSSSLPLSTRNLNDLSLTNPFTAEICSSIESIPAASRNVAVVITARNEEKSHLLSSVRNRIS